jgi:hypothetical protein
MLGHAVVVMHFMIMTSIVHLRLFKKFMMIKQQQLSDLRIRCSLIYFSVSYIVGLISFAIVLKISTNRPERRPESNRHQIVSSTISMRFIPLHGGVVVDVWTLTAGLADMIIT